MPLRATQTPPEPSGMWEAIRRLQRDLKELRAARRAENTSIGAGGITVQDPTRPEKVVIAPQGAVGILPATDGDPMYYPPGIMFYTGSPNEVTPGEMTAYNAPDPVAPIPSLLLTTPDLGNGVSYYKLQAGVSDGEQAAAILAAGASSIIIAEGAFYVTLATGTTLAFDSSGAFFFDESWQALPLNNSWTPAPSPWQAPFFQLKIDGTIQIIGDVTPGTLTASTVIATLPAGYWPTADLDFRVPGNNSSTQADIFIHASNGTLTIQNVVGTPTRLGLSGIRFPL